MTITDLVAPEAILPALKVISKKQALQELAARAAVLTGQNERSVFEVLLQREKLGTTAVGYGVAIPHGKLPKLEKLFGLFARLERPIDFEAMDGQPVRSYNDLANYIDSKNVGDKVDLKIIREGKEMTLSVTLDAWQG